MSTYCIDILIDTDGDFCIENAETLGYIQDDQYYSQKFRSTDIDDAGQLLINTVKNIDFSRSRYYIADQVYKFLSEALANLYSLHCSGPFHDQEVCNMEGNYKNSQILITRIDN